MKILIAGNGFDLAHHMPTRYSDFLEYMGVVKEILDKKITTGQEVIERLEGKLAHKDPSEKLSGEMSEKFAMYLCSNLETLIEHTAGVDSNLNKYPYLKDIFKLFKKVSTQNFWLDHFINAKEINGGWVDFEQEILEVLKVLEKETFDRIKKRGSSPIIISDWGDKGEMPLVLELYKNDCFPHEALMTDFLFNSLNEYRIVEEQMRITDFSDKREQAKKYQYTWHVDDLYSKLLNKPTFEEEDSSFYIQFDKLNPNDVAKNLLIQLEEFVRCLEFYLYECQEGLEKIHDFPKIEFCNRIQNFNAVLSFNYTDTYRRLYEEDIKYHNYHGVDFIHGSVNSDKFLESKHEQHKCDMIIGINEYLDDDEKDINMLFLQFKKFFQRVHKETGLKYDKWLDINKDIQMLDLDQKNVNQIHIIGHSLDITDKDVLVKFLLAEHYYVYIYYHSEQKHIELISKLITLIGQDDAIKYTGGANRRIEFVRQEFEEVTV